MQVNLSECAEFFGVQLNTIKAWVNKGAPVIQRGGKGTPWKLDTVEVYEWREAAIREDALGSIDFTDYEEARRRKIAAEAAMAELELMKARGELLVIEEVIADQAARDANMRARVLGIGAKIAPLIEGMSVNERRTEIDRACREALAELASGVSLEAA
ncbi:MAG: terminase small subunit [Pseudomonadota bacterium]